MKRRFSDVAHAAEAAAAEDGTAMQASAIPAAPAPAAPPPRLPRRLGTVRWYSGRRRLGKVMPDDGGPDLFIPSQGAPNGALAPPQPGGLFHGTRVSFQPVPLDPAGKPDAASPSRGRASIVCMDVRPLAGQLGLSCGLDTHSGAKEQNDDRIAAADLDELGFFCGVFDGHRGCECANSVAQGLPAAVLAEYRRRARRGRGGSMAGCSAQEEVAMISGAIVDAFEVADRAFLQVARKKELMDGSTAVVTLVSHGFYEEGNGTPTSGTVSTAPGGLAKLFVAWCGDSRAVLLRGRQGIRLSEDHKPSRADEQERIRQAGGQVVRDAWGNLRVGPREDNKLAKELQGPRKPDPAAMKWFLSTSRAFGDAELKAPDPIVVSTPDLRVVDLLPEDWAVVLGCDGIFDHLSDQEVADAAWRAGVLHGGDAIEGAKAVVQAALRSGSKDNLTAVVLRLGWAPVPTTAAAAAAPHAGGLGQPGAALEPPPAEELDMFG